jgi:two-component system response regulator QseB
MPAQPRILFVEDEQYLNEKLLRYIVAHDINAVAATTLQEATEKLAEGGFTGVLLDIMLPIGESQPAGLNPLTGGIELLRRLRQGEIAGADTALPVVCLTGRTEATIEQQIKALGVKAFLNKPETMRTVLNALQDALGLPVRE